MAALPAVSPVPAALGALLGRLPGPREAWVLGAVICACGGVYALSLALDRLLRDDAASAKAWAWRRWQRMQARWRARRRAE